MDPLERTWHGRVVVLLTAGTVLVALCLSAAGGAPTALPGVALGSPALLHVERALVVGAGMASTFIFLIRGWVGYFPSKLSTSGAEYADRSTMDAVSDGSRVAATAIEDFQAKQLEVNRGVQSALVGLEHDLGALIARVLHIEKRF